MGAGRLMKLFYPLERECSENPCKNGACIDKLVGYECNCNQGYTGKHCETGIIINVNIDI